MESYTGFIKILKQIGPGNVVKRKRYWFLINNSEGLLSWFKSQTDSTPKSFILIQNIKSIDKFNDFPGSGSTRYGIMMILENEEEHSMIFITKTEKEREDFIENILNCKKLKTEINSDNVTNIKLTANDNSGNRYRVSNNLQIPNPIPIQQPQQQQQQQQQDHTSIGTPTHKSSRGSFTIGTSRGSSTTSISPSSLSSTPQSSSFKSATSSRRDSSKILLGSAKSMSMSGSSLPIVNTNSITNNGNSNSTTVINSSSPSPSPSPSPSLSPSSEEGIQIMKTKLMNEKIEIQKAFDLQFQAYEVKKLSQSLPEFNQQDIQQEIKSQQQLQQQDIKVENEVKEVVDEEEKEEEEVEEEKPLTESVSSPLQIREVKVNSIREISISLDNESEKVDQQIKQDSSSTDSMSTTTSPTTTSIETESQNQDKKDNDENSNNNVIKVINYRPNIKESKEDSDNEQGNIVVQKIQFRKPKEPVVEESQTTTTTTTTTSTTTSNSTINGVNNNNGGFNRNMINQQNVGLSLDGNGYFIIKNPSQLRVVIGKSVAGESSFAGVIVGPFKLDWKPISKIWSIAADSCVEIGPATPSKEVLLKRLKEKRQKALADNDTTLGNLLLQREKEIENAQEEESFIFRGGIVMANRNDKWELLEAPITITNNNTSPYFKNTTTTSSTILPPLQQQQSNNQYNRSTVNNNNMTNSTIGDLSQSIISSVGNLFSKKEERTIPPLTVDEFEKMIQPVKTSILDIDAYFGSNTTQLEKKSLGDDNCNRKIALMCRGRLSTAIAQIMSHGFVPTNIIGKRQHIWDFIDSYKKVTSHGTVAGISLIKAIDTINQLEEESPQWKDANIKFRTFICCALNDHLLDQWLIMLQLNRQSVEHYFYPNALLRSLDFYRLFCQCFSPLLELPFKLSIYFECKKVPQLNNNNNNNQNNHQNNNITEQIKSSITSLSSQIINSNLISDLSENTSQLKQTLTENTSHLKQQLTSNFNNLTQSLFNQDADNSQQQHNEGNNNNNRPMIGQSKKRQSKVTFKDESNDSDNSMVEKIQTSISTTIKPIQNKIGEFFEGY
ncbi:RUN domain-containing protein [Tieghemostelium lacteum]|uniref:RUN domain-containing protein n=1 Tax=Tieghemostelium lacteum TaxID=361077 RepID=A0A151Z8X3_TIELA|nr:RUN domain-containing protein [Tieghemostelium lacteum]|eukprot:KYQ90274.1 RUN domain-containing protein [Tieghemostelium lacteum]